jgi:predicted DNA-binding protein
MSPRTGRPTDDPKTLNTRIRLSETDKRLLNYCCKAIGMSKAEVIRKGIRKVYEEISK